MLKKKVSDVFYKVVLQGDESEKIFRLSSTFEQFKGLCMCVCEQIILKNFTDNSTVYTSEAVSFHIDSNQTFSSNHLQGDNSSTLLHSIPITYQGAGNTTYVYNGEGNSCIIANFNKDSLQVRLLDNENNLIDKTKYESWLIVLKVYPMYDHKNE